MALTFCIWGKCINKVAWPIFIKKEWRERKREGGKEGKKEKKKKEKRENLYIEEKHRT